MVQTLAQGVRHLAPTLVGRRTGRLNYRIFYAYLTTQQRYYILAIVPKAEVDYDNPDHHLAARIRTAYNSL